MEFHRPVRELLVLQFQLRAHSSRVLTVTHEVTTNGWWAIGVLKYGR